MGWSLRGAPLRDGIHTIPRVGRTGVYVGNYTPELETYDGETDLPDSGIWRICNGYGCYTCDFVIIR